MESHVTTCCTNACTAVKCVECGRSLEVSGLCIERNDARHLELFVLVNPISAVEVLLRLLIAVLRSVDLLSWKEDAIWVQLAQA